MKLVETAINDTGESYIHAITEPKGWEIAEHVITELFYAKKTPPNMLESSESITDYNFNLQPGELRFIRSDIPPTKPFYESMKANGEELPPFKKLLLEIGGEVKNDTNGSFLFINSSATPLKKLPISRNSNYNFSA
jgi:hypothetical protein